MHTDRKLLEELNNSLDMIFYELTPEAKKVCRKELSTLRGMVNQACLTPLKQPHLTLNESPLTGVILFIDEIITSIDQEGEMLEKEMHGVENFSSYEYQRAQQYASRKILVDKLRNVLRHLKRARTESQTF